MKTSLHKAQEETELKKLELTHTHTIYQNCYSEQSIDEVWIALKKYKMQKIRLPKKGYEKMEMCK